MKNNFNELASAEIVNKTAKALKEKGYQTFVFDNGLQALEEIKKLIPAGSSVMNGASVTLEQIGYQDYLKSGKHSWNDFHARVRGENNPAKRVAIRKDAFNSDFYLCSVHALTTEGDFIVASNTGSQLPHIAFTSANLIFVVSTKKIVKSISEGLERIEKHIVPLEEKHMQDLYNAHTNISKILIFKKEQPYLNRKITFMLVKEDLGF